MKNRGLLFLVLLTLLLPSCLRDPIAPVTDPAKPGIGYADSTLTRTRVVLKGTFSSQDIFDRCGIEIAENNFNTGKVRYYQIEPDRETNSFSQSISLTPGMVYLARSYLAIGDYKKYSSIISISTRKTAAPTLGNVAVDGKYLKAEVIDDGGRTIKEAGFCLCEVDDVNTLRRNRYPVAIIDGNTLLYPLDSLTIGHTYYVMAYAENSDNGNEQVFGFSPYSTEIALKGNFSAWFEDAEFERQLLLGYDSDGNGKISFAELEYITDLSVNNVASLKELAWMSTLRTLSVSGKAPAGGVIDLSANTKLLCLDVAACQGLKEVYLPLSFSIINPPFEFSKEPDTRFTYAPYAIIPVSDRFFKLSLLGRYDVDGDGELSVKEASGIEIIEINDAGIESLTGIRYFVNLKELRCHVPFSAILDINGSETLERLCFDSPVADRLFVSSSGSLKSLICSAAALEMFDIGEMPSLETLDCKDCVSLLEVRLTEGQTIDNLILPPWAGIYYKGTVRFEDAVFERYCIENFDADGSGHISFEEANNVYTIHVDTDSILSMRGLEYFRNLEILNCSSSRIVYDGIRELGYGSLTELDVTRNTNLSHLSCAGNKITRLDLSRNKSLINLNCRANELESLELCDNTKLELLWCQSNRLTTLDVSKNVNLKKLICSSNMLTSLDLSNNRELDGLWCQNNNFTFLDLSKNTKLVILICNPNQKLVELWLAEDQESTLRIFYYDTDKVEIFYR